MNWLPCGTGAGPSVRASGRRRNLVWLFLWVVPALACSGADRADDSSVLARIAVLPFASVRPDTGDAALGRGLAQEVTHWLLYVPGIVVLPEDAVLVAPSVHVVSETAARDVPVDYVIDGSVLQARDGLDLEYRVERRTAEVGAVVDTVAVELDQLPQLALRIARQVVATISTDDVGAGLLSADVPVSNPAAYVAYLHALGARPNTDTLEEERLRHLSAAVQDLGGHAPAMTVLGHLYLERAGVVGGRRPYYDLAEETLLRAFELAPDFPPAREYLASLFAKRGKSERTVALMQEGLRSHPTYAAFHQTLGYVLRYAGYMEESMVSYRRSQELDRSIDNLVSAQDQITKSLIYLGDYSGALASHQKMLGYLEQSGRGVDEKQAFYEGVIHLYGGENDLAVECFRKGAVIDSASVWTAFGRAYEGIAHGDAETVAEVLEQLEQRVVVDGERHYRLVHFAAYLGDVDSALEHLQVTIEGGFFNFPYIQTDPLTAALRGRPLFDDLLRAARQRHVAFEVLLNQHDTE